jgi:hypothetical protein
MWKSIALVTVAVLLVTFLAAWWYLYTDDPYTSPPDPATLQTVAGSDLPTASAPRDTSSGPNVRVEGTRFEAPDGRQMYLRGVNLGGSSKVPYDPYLPSHVRAGFFDGADVSFVGRPFPLEAADRHFERLAAWGFHFARLLVPWEAVEHAGPGQYDEAYLDYIEQIVRRADAHGINLFIDPHQDVFSRFTGGDGAPMWAFEKVGLNVNAFSETGTALVHNLHDGDYPRMGWVTNYAKMATATMFTLFFGGTDFAPQTTVEGEPVQTYLQRHYIQAMQQVARRLADAPNVIGFDTLNEPSPGFIGVEDLTGTGLLQIGPTPTYAQGMYLADGHPQEVGVYSFGLFGATEERRTTLNPDGRRAWLDGHAPIWKQHGVWGTDDRGRPVLRAPDYFAEANGTPVDFANDYLKPFIDRYAKAIRAVDDDAVIFAEPAVFESLPEWSADETEGFVHAGHWYDAPTLLTKEYSPILSIDIENESLLLGKTAIREAFERQLASMKTETQQSMGARPTLVGEFGIPFDLNEGAAYESGDFSDQAAALDRSFNAVEENLLSYTLWNYTADNTNAHGDQWNGEDLSIFSVDQQTDPSDLDSGGRALEVVIRPYPKKIAGTLTTYQFRADTQELYVRFTPDPALSRPTELFLPKYHYGDGFVVEATTTDLAWDPERRLLLVNAHEPAEAQHVVVRPAR